MQLFLIRLFICFSFLGGMLLHSQGPWPPLPVKLTGKMCKRALVDDYTHQQILEQRVLIEDNKYVATRGIASYDRNFGGVFLNRIREFSKQRAFVFVDWGAGTARMFSDVYAIARNEKWAHLPEMIAIGKRRPRQGDGSQIEHVERESSNKVNDDKRDKYVEKMDQAIAESQFAYKTVDINYPYRLPNGKRASIAVDDYGSISYAEDLTSALLNQIDNLEKMGELFIFTDVSRTTIFNQGAGGAFLTFDKYLETIPGLRVEILYEASEVKGIRIIKLSEKVEVPELMLARWSIDSPPIRAYIKRPPME